MLYREGWHVLIFEAEDERDYPIMVDFKRQWGDVSYATVPDGPMFGTVRLKYRMHGQAGSADSLSMPLYYQVTGSRTTSDYSYHFEKFYYAPNGLDSDTIDKPDLSELIKYIHSQE